MNIASLLRWNRSAFKDHRMRQPVGTGATVIVQVNKSFKSKVRGQQADFLERVGARLLREVRVMIGEDWGGVPSQPGKPPKRRTGTLQESTYYQVDRRNATLKIGAAAPYDGYLEDGTKFMAARPHWKPLLRSLRSLMR